MPAGYAAGSDALLKQGRWGMANREVQAAAVWKVLHRPDLAAKSLRGKVKLTIRGTATAVSGNQALKTAVRLR